MNWYEKSLEIMLKEAGFLDKAIIGELLVLLPLLSYLGWTKADIFNSLERNNNDATAVKQEAIEEAQQQNVPEQIIQQVQNQINKPEAIPQNTQQEPSVYNSFRQKLINNEGYVTTANPVGNKGEIDIGIGHAMLNPNNGKTRAQQTSVSRRIFNKLFGDTVNLVICHT